VQITRSGDVPLSTGDARELGSVVGFSVALVPEPRRFTLEEPEASMEQSKDTISSVHARQEDSLVTIAVTATVLLDGELDCSTELEVTHRIARLVESSDVIRIDTRHVDFIDAAGIRTLLLAKRDALRNGATVTVEMTSPGPVERLLRITGLSDCLAAFE
jgi:anti-anti-sigma factor